MSMKLNRGQSIRRPDRFLPLVPHLKSISSSVSISCIKFLFQLTSERGRGEKCNWLLSERRVETRFPKN